MDAYCGKILQVVTLFAIALSNICITGIWNFSAKLKALIES